MKAKDTKRAAGLLIALNEVAVWITHFQETTDDDHSWVRLTDLDMCGSHDASTHHNFDGAFSVPRELAIEWFSALEAAIRRDLASIGVEVSDA